ncbi:MAG: hypothetical protein ACWGN1_04670, partial [Desulfobulbales bacterium]
PVSLVTMKIMTSDVNTKQGRGIAPSWCKVLPEIIKKSVRRRFTGLAIPVPIPGILCPDCQFERLPVENRRS